MINFLRSLIKKLTNKYKNSSLSVLVDSIVDIFIHF
jgi:hypothetical protein